MKTADKNMKLIYSTKSIKSGYQMFFSSKKAAIDSLHCELILAGYEFNFEVNKRVLQATGQNEKGEYKSISAESHVLHS